MELVYLVLFQRYFPARQEMNLHKYQSHQKIQSPIRQPNSQYQKIQIVDLPTTSADNLFDSSIPLTKLTNLLHSPIKAISSLDLFDHSTYSTFNVDSIQTTESATDELLLKKDLKRKEGHQTPTRSLLEKIDQHSSAALIDDLPTVENTNMNISDTMEHSKVKKIKIMHSSTFHFKNQEISPRKKKMQREIKTLKEKLRRKEKKLVSLQDLLKQLRQKNLLENNGCELIVKNFNGIVGDLFKNEWQNRNKSRKGCRYTDEIKKFALTLHFYSPKAYSYCRSLLHLPHASSIRNWLFSINGEPGF